MPASSFTIASTAGRCSGRKPVTAVCFARTGRSFAHRCRRRKRAAERPRSTPLPLRALIGGVVFAIVPSLAGSAAPAAAMPQTSAVTNRLIDSNDPCLLLHAHNPVDWYPWSPEALARAKQENKPIFVSIGYSTCFWCHVAERTIYSN